MNAAPSIADAKPADLVRPRIAVSITFLIAGFGTGMWAVHIPLVQARLGIDPATLGLALFVMAVGAVLSMPLAGITASHFGSRFPTGLGAILFTIVTPLPILAPSVPFFFISAFFFGLLMGFIDVSMNVQASEVESARGQPTMSSFHGFFSLGGLTGALVGAGLIAAGWGNGSGAAVVAAVLLGAAAWAAANLLPAPAHAPAGPRFALPNRAVLGLGLLALLCFATEGAVTDWSALFLANVKGASDSAAAAGFALFSLAMAFCRLVGDPVVAWLGPRRILIGGGGLIALGLVIALASPWIVLSAAGFTLVGVGAANVVPVVFSGAARTPGIAPGAGVAAVATMGYLGFLAAPPVLGFVANSYGLSASLMIVLVMGVAIAAIGASRIK